MSRFSRSGPRSSFQCRSKPTRKARLLTPCRPRYFGIFRSRHHSGCTGPCLCRDPLFSRCPRTGSFGRKPQPNKRMSRSLCCWSTFPHVGRWSPRLDTRSRQCRSESLSTLAGKCRGRIGARGYKSLRFDRGRIGSSQSRPRTACLGSQMGRRIGKN